MNEKDEEIRVLRESMSMMKKDFLELQDRMRAGEAILDEWKSTVEKTQHDIQQVRREKMELKARVAGCEALLKSNEEQIALLKSAKEDAEKKHRDSRSDAQPRISQRAVRSTTKRERETKSPNLSATGITSTKSPQKSAFRRRTINSLTHDSHAHAFASDYTSIIRRAEIPESKQTS